MINEFVSYSSVWKLALQVVEGASDHSDVFIISKHFLKKQTTPQTNKQLPYPQKAVQRTKWYNIEYFLYNSKKLRERF